MAPSKPPNTGDLVDFPGNLLLRLPFLKTQQVQIAIKQLRRVEQRTRGVRLFTTTDHIGLGQVLRLGVAVNVNRRCCYDGSSAAIGIDAPTVRRHLTNGSQK